MESICKDINIDIISNLTHNDDISDELSNIMTKYDSDKGAGLSDNYIISGIIPPNSVCHNYTYYYSKLFSNIRNENINIFEMGVGVPSCMGSWADSLLGWKEYFPNSKIFSADFDKEYLYNDNRIKSYYVDQEDIKSIQELWKNMENELSTKQATNDMKEFMEVQDKIIGGMAELEPLMQKAEGFIQKFEKYNKYN